MFWGLRGAETHINEKIHSEKRLLMLIFVEKGVRYTQTYHELRRRSNEE